MFDLIRNNQMDIMLALCAVCLTMAVLLLFTRFLPKRRKWVMINMELIAFFLLAFDRLAYIYSGDLSRTGWVMVRVSNFMVFFLTSGVVLGFDLFLADLVAGEDGNREKIPFILKIVAVMATCGMLLALVSAFTGLYYSFDENNRYQRGPLFLISYIIPVICPILQYIVIRKNRKKFGKFINIALTLYIFVPIIMGIVQIFTYGISIVNMAMVLVSVSLYIFTYLDINDRVIRAHEIELENMEGKQRGMWRLLDQCAMAFAESVEKRDKYSVGHSKRVALLARRIAETAGKDLEGSESVYYAALFNDVGYASLPDKMVEAAGQPGEAGAAARREKALQASEILSCVTEYPVLSKNVRSSHEHYDGSGYPDGLKGDEIPEAARIVAVADAYDRMRSKTRDRDPLPLTIVRELFVRDAGIRYDPAFAEIMIGIIDEEIRNGEESGARQIESGLVCDEYRSTISSGIAVTEKVIRISFDCISEGAEGGLFSAPSIVLFDSYDRRVHSNEKAIEAYQYCEYGEFWFNGHSISTNIDDMRNSFEASGALGEQGKYSIVAGRYEDHLNLRLESAEGVAEWVIALPDSTKSSYIALTGEHCRLENIEVSDEGRELSDGDIPRIADKKNYIDRFESDIPNVQVDRTRSAATQGIKIEDGLRIIFYSKSLPTANLVWHCPYVVLFSSDDGTVNGGNYHEYALIKLNGEREGSDEYATNSFGMKKSSAFPGWEKWKENCKRGMEFEVRFRKKGNRVELGTVNMGITIENETTVNDGAETVYVALTGDQVALTDIRIL